MNRRLSQRCTCEQEPPPPGGRPLAARYQLASHKGSTRGHASLGLAAYAHVSSPIRRYADLHCQHALLGSLPAAAAEEAPIEALNERATALSRYHAHTSAMELAYRCREAPMVYRGRVELDDEFGGAWLDIIYYILYSMY